MIAKIVKIVTQCLTETSGAIWTVDTVVKTIAVVSKCFIGIGNVIQFWIRHHVFGYENKIKSVIHSPACSSAKPSRTDSGALGVNILEFGFIVPRSWAV